MPINGALDPSANLFRTTVTGRVTLADLSQHVMAARRVCAHEYPGLVDARGVQTLAFNRRELIRFAQDIQGTFGESSLAPRAIVVNGLVYFGLARLFASLVAGWTRVGVFDDMETAENWLASFVSVP
jgi:hypothetical protein